MATVCDVNWSRSRIKYNKIRKTFSSMPYMAKSFIHWELLSGRTLSLYKGQKRPNNETLLNMNKYTKMYENIRHRYATIVSYHRRDLPYDQTLYDVSYISSIRHTIWHDSMRVSCCRCLLSTPLYGLRKNCVNKPRQNFTNKGNIFGKIRNDRYIHNGPTGPGISTCGQVQHPKVLSVT